MKRVGCPLTWCYLIPPHPNWVRSTTGNTRFARDGRTCWHWQQWRQQPPSVANTMPSDTIACMHTGMLTHATSTVLSKQQHDSATARPRRILVEVSGSALLRPGTPPFPSDDFVTASFSRVCTLALGFPQHTRQCRRPSPLYWYSRPWLRQPWVSEYGCRIIPQCA